MCHVAGGGRISFHKRKSAAGPIAIACCFVLSQSHIWMRMDIGYEIPEIFR